MNRFSKTSLALLLVMSLLAAIPAFATSSPEPKVIASADIERTTYNRQVQMPVVTVYDDKGEEVDPELYDVIVDDNVSPKDHGSYPVTIKGKQPLAVGEYKGLFYIDKAKNPFRITADKYTFKYSATKDQTTKLHPAAVKGGAHLVFSSSNSKVVVDGPNRKVTIKKGFKGTVTIRCTAKATKNYYATTKTIKLTVK